ncbi:MAG: hypothetical protein K6F52_04730 [Clostridia bacterium]|nr:hypothetical protein [Clostridia bacterium]
MSFLKNMNGRGKRLLALGLAGCLILGTTVFSLASETSGYEAYKDALKKTAMMSSTDDSYSVIIKVKDNGESVIESTSKHDEDKAAKTASEETIIKVNGKETVIKKEYKDGKMYVDCNGNASVEDYIYFYDDANGEIRSENEVGTEDLDFSSNGMKLAEMIFDTLVGDTKSHFVKDGNIVYVNLDDAQIPELAKLAAITMIEQLDYIQVENTDDSDVCEQDIVTATAEVIPKLKNIEINKLAMNSDITGGILHENDFRMIYTGVDAKGVSHTVDCYFSMATSDLNQQRQK